MTQPSTVDELLKLWGEAVRARFPQRTPEEEARDLAASRARIAAEWKVQLDAENAVACALCLTRRPRVRDDEPLHYPAAECVNVRKPWHYYRKWTSRSADQREARRHRRRLRKGRLPQTPSASTTS